jgi:hypothetical protein
VRDFCLAPPILRDQLDANLAMLFTIVGAHHITFTIGERVSIAIQLLLRAPANARLCIHRAIIEGIITECDIRDAIAWLPMTHVQGI